MIDFGTGDGRFVTSAAATDPDALVIGLDASLAGLGAGFERARQRRLTNALFAVATAEEPPSELRATADELVIQFPWGSILRALVTPGEVLRGITDLLAPRGRLELSLSIVPRDGVPGLGTLDLPAAQQLACDIASACALESTGVRLLSWADVRCSGSSWAKRLGVGRNRDGYRLSFRNRLTTASS